MISEVKPYNDIYNSEYVRVAGKVAEETGANDKSIIKILGVDVETFYRWIKDHPEFKQAIQDGRDIFNTTKLEKVLVKRAAGYNYKEVETGTRDGKAIEIIKHKSMPASVEALEFYLTNRSNRWQKQKDTGAGELASVFAMIVDTSRVLPGTKDAIRAIEEESTGGDRETTPPKESPHTDTISIPRLLSNKI